MNLYKFNFDLAGSANKTNIITIPTDSKYSIGVKFFKGNEELILGDDVKVTIQDDEYIYTPTEIFNNYAVFADSTGSSCKESKTYQVNFHKDGKNPDVIKDQENTMPRNTSVNTGIKLTDITALVGPNFEDFDYQKLRFYAEVKDPNKDYSDYDNAETLSYYRTQKTTFAMDTSDVYLSALGSTILSYGTGNKAIYMWKIGDKYGWISKQTMIDKAGQKTDKNDFLKGSISEYFNGSIPTTSKVMKTISALAGDVVKVVWLYGDKIPAVNQSFNGINIKTNESKISNWAITDSQMKIVYTDEWPELSATADDRVIYFVVDKPTPPQPVPPKPVPPTPPGDGDYALDMFEKNGDEPTRETTFDPSNIEDCVATGDSEVYKKYNINGQEIYLAVNTDTSKSQISEQYPDMGKTDIIIPAIFTGSGQTGEEHQATINGFMIQDGILKLGQLYKDFQTDDEVNEYIDNYLSGITDYDHPFEYQLPDDINEFEMLFEDITEYAEVEKTNDGYYVYYPDDEFGDKLFIPLSTAPQWTAINPH